MSAWVPLHVAAVVCGLHAVAQLPEHPAIFWPGLTAIAISVAMVGGTLGGAIAHELMHAPRTVERVVGAGVTSLITYGHFSIGHVAGHHRWVGTAADPATARRGESLYAFCSVRASVVSRSRGEPSSRGCGGITGRCGRWRTGCYRSLPGRRCSTGRSMPSWAGQA